MKTLEEVKAHLLEVGYRNDEIPIIEGFLFGKGLYEGEEFEIEYIDGDHDFYDFKDWFEGKEQPKSKVDWNDFSIGDFIHVEKDMDVLLLSDIYNGKFVGTTGNIIHQFNITEESRPCDEDEMRKVIAKLQNNGIDFRFGTDELVPCGFKGKFETCKLKEDVKELREELKKNYDEFCELVNTIDDKNPLKSFSLELKSMLDAAINNTLKEDEEEVDIDKLEIESKQAIENIIANLISGEMDELEREKIIDALKVLIELGETYE